MNNIVKFLDRNWINTASNVLLRHCYPGYSRVDTRNVSVLKTQYGSFNYNRALRDFPDVFEQIEEYNVSDFSKDDVVLDVGANIGVFTVKIAPMVKHVIAVEPLFYQELKDNVKLNNLENVTCLPYSLGTGSSFKINFCGKEAEIQSLKLNDILAKCPYKPNVLKTDCEGGEWAINSAEEFAEHFDKVEGEFHNFDYLGNKCEPEDWLDSLKAVGYTCTYEHSGRQLMIHARK